MGLKFLIPLLVGIITQFIKLTIDFLFKRFSTNKIFSYGGMPSSHTATVVSLCVVVYKFTGLNSPEFAISFIFSCFIIWDAIGFRKILGQHSELLQNIIKTLPQNNKNLFKNITTKIGHTLPQVLVGGIIGFLLTLLFV